MQKHIHVNSSFGGFQTSTKRVHSGRVNGKDVFTDFLVVAGTSHIIRDSTMNGIFYPAAAFDDLANRLMTSNERVPAPLSHPSDEQGRFISAKDPLILSAHGIFSFDTNWRISGDKLISDTYIDVKRAAENPHASWLIERLNNRQPIDRSTGLELMISETSGVGPDGDEYHMRVEEIVNLDHSAILNPESEPGAKCGLDGIGMYVNASGEHAVENVDLYVNASNPNLSLPIAPKGYDWNEAEAVGRIREYTGSEEAPTSHYRKFFMYFSADNVDDFSSYKLPFADIIDGRPHAVIGALSLIDGVLAGTKEGADIPDADKEKISRNVEHYKSKLEDYVQDSKLARLMNWIGAKFGIDTIKEYNASVVNNNSENEVDPMKDKILAALNAAGVKTDGLDDNALFAAYNESMKPKPKSDEEDDMEDDKKEKADAANSKLLEAINALAAEVKEIKTASNASAKAEIDALAAQVANANILPLDDAKKLSKDALNGLLAKSGVVVANGAGGYVAAPTFEQLPE